MTDAATKAGWKEWIGLAVLVLPCLLVSMDLSVLFFALPFLSADLAPSGTQLLWIMDIYGFLLAGMLITMGSLGDRIGRRRLLLAGAATFGLASILAAYSTSAGMLIASRALLGVAGATLAPSTLALIRNLFHDSAQRRSAIGIWTAGFAGGAMLGPIVGGLLLEHFWWGSVFLLNVPIMVLLLVAGRALLPEFRDSGSSRFDLLGALLSLAFVLPVIYGIKKLAEDGLGPMAVLALVGGLVVGVVFVRRQKGLADPVLDVRLFRDRTFSASIATNALTMFALAGLSLYSSQYLQLVLGMRPLTAALWSLPSFLGMPIGVAFATVATRRIRPAYVIGAGLLVAALGFAMLTQLEVDSSLAVILAGGAAMAAGVGAVATLVTDLVVAAAPPERAGAASALSETGAEFGGALGIAVLGSVGVAAYRANVGAAVPASLPAEALNAARETLGGAAEVARGLPERVGEALLRAAREAFVDGLQLTTAIGSAIMVAAAVVATIMLRHLRPESDQDVPSEPVTTARHE
ncbi:MFS transporter [Actinopolymorpha alba]|uniref:MFS transporter n=1 Tax=Actinopolymorpha alba TaxID=533267 RepID=UPI00037405B9|nr:MFS transporter [Actinopolymorpha alba]